MKNFIPNLLEKFSACFTFARWLHQHRSTHTGFKLASLFFVGLKSWSEQGTLMVAKSEPVGEEVEALMQQRVSMPLFLHYLKRRKVFPILPTFALRLSFGRHLIPPIGNMGRTKMGRPRNRSHSRPRINPYLARLPHPRERRRRPSHLHAGGGFGYLIQGAAYTITLRAVYRSPRHGISIAPAMARAMLSSTAARRHAELTIQPAHTTRVASTLARTSPRARPLALLLARTSTPPYSSKPGTRDPLPMPDHLFIGSSRLG
jgi:hypothetical protein